MTFSQCVGRLHCKFLEHRTFSVTLMPQSTGTHTNTCTHTHREHSFYNNADIRDLLTESSIRPVRYRSVSFAVLSLLLLPASALRGWESLSTDWLLLAALQLLWKPVSFPQASQSFRSRWGPGNYLFLRYYSEPRENKRHNMHPAKWITKFFSSPVSVLVTVLDLRLTVVLLKFPAFFLFTETEKTCLHIWNISN